VNPLAAAGKSPGAASKHKTAGREREFDVGLDAYKRGLGKWRG